MFTLHLLEIDAYVPVNRPDRPEQGGELGARDSVVEGGRI